MPEQMFSLTDRIRLVVEWAPAIQILPAIAAAPAGQARAVEVMRLLEFLARKSDLKMDDEIVQLIKAILLTKEGGALADYVAQLISGAISYEQSRYPGA